MIIHCSKCDINWAALHSSTDESGDDVYEFCPECKSAQWLEAATDITAYIKCPFTGSIIDVDTGDELIRMPKILYRHRDYKPEKIHETREQREAREDAAFDAYHQAYHIKGAATAQQIFFQTLQKQIK